MSAPLDPQDPRPGDRTPPPGGPAGQQGYPQQFPSYPAQYSASPQYGPGNGYAGGQAPQPGVFPLRPLTVGEILAAGFRIARGRNGALILLALAMTVVTSALTLGLTALTGSLPELVSGRWALDIVEGRRTTLPSGIWVNLASGLALGLVSFAVMYGVATAVVARSAVGHPLDGLVAERLRGRWPVLLGVAGLVTVLSLLGLVLFIVPGVLLYLVWIVAMPVAVMERTGVGQALRRSAELTRGHKGRIFGTVMAWLGIDLVANVVVNRVVMAVAGEAGTTSFFVTQAIVSGLVAAVFQAWLAAIVAVVYVDLRIRKENLGPALAAAAAQSPPSGRTA